jgi:hypothetical protein
MEWETSFPYPYGSVTVTGKSAPTKALCNASAKELVRHFVEHL